MRIRLSIFFIMFGMSNIYCQNDQMNTNILNLVNEIIDSHRAIYKELHQHPELSLMEVRTAETMAEGMRKLGFEVTKGLGGNGVVGIFRNGIGKTVLLRTDMDALPVREMTGLPFASNVIMKDAKGNENPVMHACGHDMHMTTFLGTLSILVSLKDKWKGTLMAVAQPAEEGMAGAAAMLEEGLYTKFPVPDFALCYHVNAEMPAGTIGYLPGPIFAGVRSAEITVFGKGGHGAMPHKTIDPIVIASRIVLDIQTIVSRVVNPVKPAVVTVGSIHGGTRANVIPDEVKMQLTIRFFEDEVFEKIKESLINICKGAATSAGIPEDKLPVVTFSTDDDRPVVNNSDLVMAGVSSMKSILGDSNIIQVDPATVAEDFGKYGQTKENVPIALFWLGGVNPSKYEESRLTGSTLPPLHSSSFFPDFDPAFRAGVTAMSRTIIDILRNKK